MRPSVVVEPDEQWEFKDNERVVLLLSSERRVLLSANLQDFVYLEVRGIKDGDGE